MIYINITKFVLISWLEKDHSRIERRRLTNIVIFIQANLTFALSRKIINIYNDIARRYWNVTDKFFENMKLQRTKRIN